MGNCKSIFHEPESYLKTLDVEAGGAYGALRICRLVYKSMRKFLKLNHKILEQKDCSNMNQRH